MSGYVSGLLAMLAINTIIAYSVFVPASAGLLNLGAAGFVLVGAYSAGALTMLWELPLWVAVPLGAVAAGLVAFLIAFPILRTRGIYMVLATKSNQYAMEKFGLEPNIKAEDLKAFFDILLMSGYNQMTDYRMYWSKLLVLLHTVHNFTPYNNVVWLIC